MAMVSRISDIDRQAADWVAKTDGVTLSVEVRSELDAWLASDARHLGAYLRAKTILARVERHGLALRELRTVPSPNLSWPSRRLMLGGALAASVAVAAVFFDLHSQSVQPLEFATAMGERRVVSLPDKSIATLNTDTKITAYYNNGQRSIAIERGEAIFAVAKDKDRPFVVTTRGIAVRAVGTRFAVRSLAMLPVEILVEEGVVRVEGDLVRPIPALRANSTASVFSASKVVIKTLSPEEVLQKLAWRDGYIVFHHQSLAAAAREFSRYSRTPIVIDDPEVAKRTVTGSYAINDPVGFAKAAALALNLKVELSSNEVRLTGNKR